MSTELEIAAYYNELYDRLPQPIKQYLRELDADLGPKALEQVVHIPPSVPMATLLQYIQNQVYKNRLVAYDQAGIKGEDRNILARVSVPEQDMRQWLIDNNFHTFL